MHSGTPPGDNTVSRVPTPVPDLGPAYWQTRYDQGKTGWDRGGTSPMLSRWLGAGDLTPCRVLVPGCGRGHEVITLAEAGFDVTAIDFADSAVQSLREELSRRGLKARVIQADLFQFSPAEPFDAIYEQTCLCAINPSLRKTYESLLADWLRPGGKLFALFMQTENPEGPPFSCPVEAMRALFSDRWNWESGPVRIDHPMSLHELACILVRR